VRRALEGLEGVTTVSVELETGRAVIDYRQGTVTDGQVIGAIRGTVLLPGLRRRLAKLHKGRRASLRR
jgi:copper chaperone CopZ